MKKLISTVLLVSALCAVSAKAELDPKAMPIIRDLQSGADNGNTPTTLVVKPRNTVAAQAVVVGPSATAVYMAQSFSKTTTLLGGAVSLTNTFSPVFISAPVVTWRYASDSLSSPTNIVSVTASNVSIAGPSTNYEGIAYGRVK